MSEVRKSRVRVVLAKYWEDECPCVMGAVDESVWEHMDEEDEDKWMKRAREMWGELPGTEFRQAWVELPRDQMRAVFSGTVIEGEIRDAS